MWNGEGFQRFRKQKMTTFLKSNDLLYSEKLEKLIAGFSYDAEKAKTNIPVVPAILASLFIPLWNNMISWIYRQNDVLTFKAALDIFIVIFFIIIMITGLIMMLKMLVSSILDDLLNGDYKKKSLCKMLEEIKFDIDIE